MTQLPVGQTWLPANFGLSGRFTWWLTTHLFAFPLWLCFWKDIHTRKTLDLKTLFPLG
jgi:hypothetical protein